MINLKQIKEVHFTGIKGVGMTALALALKDKGMKVTGSDFEEHFVTDEILKKAKISWQVGFNENNFQSPDLLIFTAAHLGEDNLEVKAALKRKIPCLSQAQALGLLMKGKKGISVAGVGGKSTTAAMLATIFANAGKKPSYAVGVGEIFPLGLPGKFQAKGEHFIAEADEYFASPKDKKPKFLYQKPEIIVITNLEYDHPDVYKNFAQTLKAFSNFINQLPKNGLLIINLDNPHNQKLLQLIKVKTMTYGTNAKADWQIGSINQTKNTFTIKHKKIVIKDIKLSVPGKFNVFNAAAAAITSFYSQIPINLIKKGLVKFQGTKRRFEFIKNIQGIKLYDDYAHHPKEIKATLQTAKDYLKPKKLWVVFQPHTYSRTKALFKDFSQAFKSADKTIITDIYASAREKKDLSISGKVLAQAINKESKNAIYLKDKQTMANYLARECKTKDIIFTLGAGDIFNWHASIIKAIESK